MRMAIFGDDADPISVHTREVATRLGHDAQIVDLSILGGAGSFAFDGASWLVDGADVSTFDGFVLRAFPSSHAMPPVERDLQWSADTWWQWSLARREAASAAESLLMDLELAKKRIVNPWLACAPFDHKPLQLACFRRAGLPLPATMITNASKTAIAFAESHAAVIAKPVVGGAKTRLFSREMMEGFDLLPAPIILQERIVGPDIRVTIVADRIVSAVEIPTVEIDYRADADYRAGKQRYVSHALDAQVAVQCLDAARLCNHILSGIDLKRRPTGEYVFLEANSAPVYLDIEHRTGAAITEAIVSHLAVGPPP